MNTTLGYLLLVIIMESSGAPVIKYIQEYRDLRTCQLAAHYVRENMKEIRGFKETRCIPNMSVGT